MYESRGEPILPRGRFIVRLAQHSAGAFALVVLSLFIGMAGYAGFEHLSWLDAFLNAAMLMGGMGPVNNPVTPGGKLFAGLYALYCGLVVIVTMGVVLAPILHRALHKFHWRKDYPK
jgi:hypothetical protein